MDNDDKVENYDIKPSDQVPITVTETRIYFLTSSLALKKYKFKQSIKEIKQD